MTNRGRHKKLKIPITLLTIPKRILTRIMECQVEQGNKADLTVFQRSRTIDKFHGGFNWEETVEGYYIWYERLINDSPF